MVTEKQVNDAYEEWAAKMVAKYGFCNWQCKDAWLAAVAWARDDERD